MSKSMTNDWASKFDKQLRKLLYELNITMHSSAVNQPDERDVMKKYKNDEAFTHNVYGDKDVTEEKPKPKAKKATRKRRKPNTGKTDEPRDET